MDEQKKFARDSREWDAVRGSRDDVNVDELLSIDYS